MATSPTTTRMNEQGQVTLPEAVRVAARVAPNTEFTVEATADGSIVLRPARDPDQWWFWTEEWQAGERQADADLAAGRLTHYDSDEAFLRSLLIEAEDVDKRDADLQ